MQNDTDFVDQFSSVNLIFLLLEYLGLSFFLFYYKQIFTSFCYFFCLKGIMLIMSVMNMAVFYLPTCLCTAFVLALLIRTIESVEEERRYLSINRSHRNRTFLSLVFSNFDNLLNSSRAMAALLAKVRNFILVYR